MRLYKCLHQRILLVFCLRTLLNFQVFAFSFNNPPDAAHLHLVHLDSPPSVQNTIELSASRKKVKCLAELKSNYTFSILNTWYDDMILRRQMRSLLLFIKVISFGMLTAVCYASWNWRNAHIVRVHISQSLQLATTSWWAIKIHFKEGRNAIYMKIYF